jgi:hypothetical protein
MPPEHKPVHARWVVTTGWHGQSVHLDAVAGNPSKVESWRKLRGNHHIGLAYASLHENQEGHENQERVVGKWFLTDEVLRAEDKDDVEVEGQ